MEKFKLDNYSKDFSKLLAIWSLDQNLSNFIFDFFLKTINLNSSEFSFENILNLFKVRQSVSDLDDTDGFLSLLHHFDLKQTKDDAQVFLIWNINTEIDICTWETLCKDWEYIWYGASDEALIIFIPDSAIIVITDWGEVGVKKYG